jgi:putative hemolysin
VEPVEHELIEGVMQIADQPVRSIMTPRTEVTWLDAHADAARFGAQSRLARTVAIPSVAADPDRPLTAVAN